MRQRLDRMNVEQARAVSVYSPGGWVVRQTPEGWLAQKGGATLYGTNSRAPRVFRTVSAAVARLQAEVGVTELRVELLPPAEAR